MIACFQTKNEVYGTFKNIFLLSFSNTISLRNSNHIHFGHFDEFILVHFCLIGPNNHNWCVWYGCYDLMEEEIKRGLK